MLTVQQIPTYLAWSFTHILPGTFKRNRPEFMHHDYPILGPLPTSTTKQQPLEGGVVQGPFIYFIQDGNNSVFYVGKSEEPNVLKRWVRPGNGGPATHYWTHSIRSGGCVFNIAAGLRASNGPFHLRFTTLAILRERFADELRLNLALGEKDALQEAESRLIQALAPTWNRP